MAETVTNASVSLFDRLFGGDSSIVALVIAAIAAIIAFMEYRRSDFSLRRLEQVISPLFEMIEPTMMRNAARTDNDTVSKVVERIKSEPVLAGGKLRAYRALSTSAPSFSREWDSLCKRVSRDYDWLCRWNNIPRRSIRYRLQHYKWRFAIIPVIHLAIDAMKSNTLKISTGHSIHISSSIIKIRQVKAVPPSMSVPPQFKKNCIAMSMKALTPSHLLGHAVCYCAPRRVCGIILSKGGDPLEKCLLFCPQRHRLQA